MLSYFSSRGSDKDAAAPDFAYPQTVIEEAQKSLENANNGIDRLRAVLEICAAKERIDPSEIFKLPSFVEKQSATPGLTDADRAMFAAYQAQLYGKIYERKSYIYDGVEAPLEPFPDDVSKWSGEQFKSKINELFLAAEDYARKDNVALPVYEHCLEYNDAALRYVPDLRGFIAQLISRSVAAGSFPRTIADAYIEGSEPWFFWQVALNKDGREGLYKIYDRYRRCEAARYVLACIYDASEYYEDAAAHRRNRNRLIADLRESRELFPRWHGNNKLENELAELTQPTLEIRGREYCAPWSNYEVRIEAEFVGDFTLTLYRLPSEDRIEASKLKKRAKRLGAFGGSANVLSDTTMIVEIPIDEPGHYALIPSINGVATGNPDAFYFKATPLLPMMVGELEDNAVIVADFCSGAPLRATVNLELSSWRSNSSKHKKLGNTGADGVLYFENENFETWQSQVLSFKYKGRSYAFDNDMRVSRFYERSHNTNDIEILIFTDRPIYHPGDTIRWAAVAANAGKTVAGAMLDIELLNTNFVLAETKKVTTDAHGRVFGEFVTKKDILTGYWSIRVKHPDGVNAERVMVSDFRVPTFAAEVTNVERDVPAKGAVRITGEAKTYSGMPVVAATVDVVVYGANRWRWFSPSRELVRMSVNTDAAGIFTFDISANTLSQPLGDDDEAFRDFFVAVTVTSLDGSTVDTSRSFTTGKPYVIQASAPFTVVDGSKPVAVNFSAYDAMGKDVALTLKWKLADKDDAEGNAMLSGTATAGLSESIDISALPAGYYTMIVEPVDAELAEPNDGLLLTIYSEARNEIPAGEPLFVPVHSASVVDGKVDVLVGVNTDVAYIYSIVNEGKSLKEVKLHTLNRGFNHISVDIVDAKNSKLVLASVYDGTFNRFGIEIKMPAENVPEIKAESFRDKLTPGATETWRFRMLDGNGTPLADAAMIATLYNRALEELQQKSLPTGFYFYSPSYTARVSSPWMGISQASVKEELKRLVEEHLIFPEFRFINTWQIGVKFGKNRFYKEAMLASPAMGSVEESSVEMEMAEDAVSLTSNQSESAGTVVEPVAEQFEYRTGEVLQGFWEPSLLADSIGNIDICFTVPNANGSWRLNAFAWTTEAKTANYIAECLANKPVMVQPNLPRFLRQGDKAHVLVNVYNNGEEIATVTTTVEIFDIESDEIMGTATSVDTIAAKGSALVGIDLEAPVDAAAIGYRVRAQAGSFADGEQTLIPILSASTTVIESTEFYLNPKDSKPFEITVKNSADATLTLQYCQNPVWTMVKAMRGIASQQPTTTSAIISKIFSALAAKKIIGENEEIAAAVRAWQDNPSEKALTSMLEKNETLKRLMLDQTPWLQAAKNESQRMAALCGALNPAATAASLKSLTEALLKLRNADGGFAWTSWSKQSSVWSTETVLITLGLAHSLDMLPEASSLNDVLQPAFDYLVAEALKPKMPETDYEISLIATLLPQLKTARASALISRTLDKAAKSWRNGDVSDKAWDVILLSKGQPATAAQILESIRQYGVVRDGVGLCFPSINDIRSYANIIQAYTLMGASADEIDAMRQWILVQAQATDDLGAYNPDYVIVALLMTGSNWVSIPVAQNVTVNGKSLEITDMESATGYFSNKISGEGKKLTVSIQPNGVTPSYGSVVSVRRESMTKVKARPGKDLSIDKRVLVQRDGKWVETNDFALGERLRVQLTIVAKRNLEYVCIDDERPAAFEPVEQLPGYIWDGGTGFYRENLDASTRMFISWLPAGTYHLTYDMTANLSGTFVSGIATLQSQLAPELTAHSSAASITVK